ncbi:MAG: SMP-30/gluconolactonase/LRE family protein [Proteobacteria bacterium]|nr:SMP-30/gluconolactonase/LRE family protein [Pseudomonadota bacterium]
MSYFEPPKIIETEIFAELPENLYKTGGKNSGGRPARHSFLEGPSFDRAGNLYVTDIPYGRVFRISPEGDFELIAEYEGEPNGLKIHKDGRIFIADHRQGIMLLDPNSGAVTSFLEGPDKERFKGVNDLVFASNGDLYFTDQGQTGLHDPTGRIYRYSADGALTCLLDTIPSPNGIVLNRSEKVVLIAVTRANAVWLAPLTETGVTKVGLFAQLPGPGPDGMAMDEDGNVAVAHPGMGVVWVYDRKAIPIYRIQSCAGSMITNIAYGGEDRRTLYMTDSSTGSVLCAKMPVAGRIMYSHM